MMHIRRSAKHTHMARGIRFVRIQSISLDMKVQIAHRQLFTAVEPAFTEKINFKQPVFHYVSTQRRCHTASPVIFEENLLPAFVPF